MKQFFIKIKKGSLALLVMAFIFCQATANPDLTYLGPFGGDVRSLALHPERPDRIFLGTSDGQIFISRDRGESWERTEGLQRRKLVIDSIVFNPFDPDTVYAGGWELKRDRGQLYRSTDGGRSWKVISLGRNLKSSVRAVAVSPLDPELLAVGITEGVMLSRDGGESWDRISRGYRSMHNVHSLAFDHQKRETLFVGTFRLGWRTDDLGGKWHPLKQGVYWDSDFFSIQINPRDNNNVIIGACSGFYRSRDRGDNWKRLRNGLPAEAKRTRVVGFDPSSPETVFAGTTAGLYKSDNGGDSWNLILENAIVNSLIVHPRDSRLLLVGTDDMGVVVSRDGGNSFQSSNRGFIHRQVSAVAWKEGNPSYKLYAAITMDRQHGGFFYSSDSGTSWTQSNRGLGEAAFWITSILPSELDEKVYLATREGIFVSSPSLVEWQQLGSTAKLDINQIAFSGTGEDHLLVASAQGLFSLDPKEDRISRIETGIYQDGISSVITLKGKSFAGTNMGVFSSAGDGEEWKIDVEGLPFVAVNSLAYAGNYIYCTTGSGIFRMNLEGSKWEPLPSRRNGITSITATGKEPVIAGAETESGNFSFSRDQGESWESYDLAKPLSPITCLSAEPGGSILAGTISEGLVRITLPKQE